MRGVRRHLLMYGPEKLSRQATQQAPCHAQNEGRAPHMLMYGPEKGP